MVGSIGLSLGATAQSFGPMRYAADLRTVGFATWYFAFMVGQWMYRDLASESVGFKLTMFLLSTFFAFQGAVTVHNAAHCPVFNRQWMNDIFMLILTAWSGAPASAYIPGHNLSHHKYLQTRKDIMRTSKSRWSYHWKNLVTFFPTIIASVQNNDFSYFQAQYQMGRPIWMQFLAEMLLFYGTQVMLGYTNVWKWLWIVFGPQILGKDMIVTLNLLQHDGCDAKHKYNHSRNFTSPLLNYLCFNNGYHTIHHMMPGVHWSLTKRKHDKLVVPYIHPNLLQSSIWGYTFRTFFYPGIRQNYDGTPYVGGGGINGEEGEDEPWFYAQSSMNATGSNPDKQLHEEKNPAARLANKPTAVDSDTESEKSSEGSVDGMSKKEL